METDSTFRFVAAYSNTTLYHDLTKHTVHVASSASDVSTLLVCTALQPQITHRPYSKFSRVLRLCRYERHKMRVWPAYWFFLIHTGMLASCWAAIAPLSQ